MDEVPFSNETQQTNIHLSLRLQPCMLSWTLPFYCDSPQKLSNSSSVACWKSFPLTNLHHQHASSLHPDAHQIHDRWVYSDNSALLLFICIPRLMCGIWRAGRKIPYVKRLNFWKHCQESDFHRVPFIIASQLLNSLSIQLLSLEVTAFSFQGQLLREICTFKNKRYGKICIRFWKGLLDNVQNNGLHKLKQY